MRPIMAIAAASVLLPAGCASINPRPVDPSKHYETDGIRYYEARPFIAVHKPYPLDSESYLVDGIVSPDGQFVRITGEVRSLTNSALQHAKDALTIDQIATQNILVVDSALPPLPPPAPREIPRGQGEGETPAPLKTGTASLAVQTDLTGVGFFPVADSFSIIYLPDYDREFVIDANPRFGNVNVDLKRGPGGVLLAMSSEVDNSAITGPLVKAYSEMIGLMSQAAQTAVRGAAGVPVPAGGVATPAAQSEGAQATVKEMKGKPITLRVHVIKFAALGVYPLIKPAEVAMYKASEADLEKHHYIVPVRQYHVPYKYFTLIVAEHLVGGGASLMQGGRAEGKKSSSLPSAFQTLGGQSKAEQLSGLNALLIGADPPLDEVQFTEVNATVNGETGTLDVKVGPKEVGQPMPDQSVQDAVKDFLKELYPGVTVTVAAAG